MRKKEPKLIRFNFDRRETEDSKPMAEGIAVHAPDLMGAFTMAEMMNDDHYVLTFRDNAPCASQCRHCQPV
jgi:hypothetical protein